MMIILLVAFLAVWVLCGFIASIEFASMPFPPDYIAGAGIGTWVTVVLLGPLALMAVTYEKTGGLK